VDDNKLNTWKESRKRRIRNLSSKNLLSGIIAHDWTALSAAITLVESFKETDFREAQELIKLCLPYSGNSVRIGITGVPGVGKSTFIEAFGELIANKENKIAVLAIDPSSSLSKGSILGDKTRMNMLSMNENVFIRPSPAGSTLGGVARKTREAIILCEAAGFNYIFIETVGVGQSETVVKSMVVFFLLLMLTGAGDELQGIKKGIMEMADAVVITKADGENSKKSEIAAREYRNAIHLFPPNENNWIPKVLTCSAIDNFGLDEIHQMIKSFENQTKNNGSFEFNRRSQDRTWFLESLKELIYSNFFSKKSVKEFIKEIENKVANGEITSFQGAELVFDLYKKNETGI